MQPHENYNPYAPPSADVDQGLQTGGDDYVLAERGTRLGAALIDGLLLFASVLPGFVLLAALAGLENLDPSRMVRRLDDGLLIVGILVMVLMVLAFQIYQWYLIATTGQSLAKRWLGIKIVRLDGSPTSGSSTASSCAAGSSARSATSRSSGCSSARQPADDLR
jgi:hypothetical protein